jgi:hypothetical protein
MYDIEPETMTDNVSIALWFEDEPTILRWKDLFDRLPDRGFHPDIDRFIDEVSATYGENGGYVECEFIRFLEDLVAHGWGVYYSDTRALLWSPEMMFGHKEDPHRLTNTEFVTELMEFSPYGALCQGFIMSAIESYAQHWAKQPPEDNPGALIPQECMVGIGKDILAKIQARAAKR